MRILQVRFKNLNSLVGEWSIDFTHPAYSSDGIFAITGPTGAGKTTILDAICLALYGRTPRLNKVTKGINDIMSRQTGECFAEVTFETQAGRFRCHWSQHRARRKADGELQSPKHEMANADSGEIFETKLRGVADQISAATGMDFDRFTRSMLLAQGGFAAFLQASADDRAPILEQITGTEIYSQISMRVHETRAEHRKQLDNLQSELKGMQLLSAEEEQQLSESLQQKRQDENGLGEQLEQTRQGLRWLEGIHRLEQDQVKLNLQQADWQSREQAFQAQAEKLRQANKALELAGDYSVLKELRAAQQREQQTHTEKLAMLPDAEAAVKRSDEAVVLVNTQVEQARQAQKDAGPVIRKARELDLKLQEKEAPLKQALSASAEQQRLLAELQSRQEGDQQALANKANALEQVQSQLQASQVDEGLVEHLAGFRNRFDAVKTLNHQHSTCLESIHTAEAQLNHTTQNAKTQTEKLEHQKRELQSLQNTLVQQQLELTQLLDGQESGDWRSRVLTLTQSKQQFKTLSEALQVSVNASTELEDITDRQHVLATSAEKLAEQLQAQLMKQSTLEREIELLDTQLTLVKTIQSFEQARHQLQDGEACPLCGALEHPFAQGNIPVADETTLTLNEAKEKLKATINEVSAIKVRQAENSKDVQQLVVNRQACVERLDSAAVLINQTCAQLELEATAANLSQTLHERQQQLSEELTRAESVIKHAELMEKKLTTLRNEKDRARELAVQLERELQTSLHQQETAQQSLERLAAEAQTLKTQLDNTRQQLQQDVLIYGIEPLAVEHLDQILATLQKRRDAWVTNNKLKSELQQQVTELEISLRHDIEKIHAAASELKKQQERVAELQTEREGLRSERQQLLADKNPDEEESRLIAAVERADATQQTAREAFNHATQELAKLTHQIEELKKAMSVTAEKLKSVEAAFIQRLTASGFVDEASYTAACLSERDRNTLLQQSQQLSNEQVSITSKLQEITAQLEATRKENLTESSRVELEQELTNLSARQKTLQQEIGGIDQKLKDNERVKQTQQQRVQQIEAQKRECSRWDMLHELIGSADGKKFRNFAQGLTFEMMVGHANRQLQKMTDRYLLIRDTEQPLELNVVDNYQAGEIRSTKNLSGGESFIVSLALALGLSHMASKNVRVDSLFLDEGFGTLDEEALETALETLSGLQQEGKLIGVISHVSALKERIATQIQVTPQTGGRSVISGPGCSAGVQ